MVVISAPDRRSCGAAIASFPRGGFAWAYLGQDVAVADRCEDAVGPAAKRIEISRPLKAAATALRQEYIEYIGRLGRARRSAEWWSSTLAEKNPYVSNTFFVACCVATCREIVGRGGHGDALLFVVDNVSLRRALARNLAGATFEVRVVERRASRLTAVAFGWRVSWVWAAFFA